MFLLFDIYKNFFNLFSGSLNMLDNMLPELVSLHLYRVFSLVIQLLIVIKIIFILVGIAFYTLAERKVMAAIQRRVGPQIVGIWGLLQPIADGVKLVLKELLFPVRSTKVVFVLAPCIFLVLSFTLWSIVPHGTKQLSNILYDYSNWTIISAPYFGDITYSILFLLAISGLSVYPVVFGGWSSNSKYAFLGGLRSSAQMISYEVFMGLTILPILLISGSFNFGKIVLWQKDLGWFFFPLLINAIIFCISLLAETNRAPFDLPEAEGELVAGYNVEYASIAFAMFFLAEYGNMLLMSTITTILFFGGWLCGQLGFYLKVVLFCYLFILMRAAFPRYRYDQLMDIGWKFFLPVTLANLILSSIFFWGLL